VKGTVAPNQAKAVIVARLAAVVGFGDVLEEATFGAPSAAPVAGIVANA
jgi:hypothetical protein